MLKTLILVKLLCCQSNLWNLLAYIAIGLPKFYSISSPLVISRAGFATDGAHSTLPNKAPRVSLLTPLLNLNRPLG